MLIYMYFVKFWKKGFNLKDMFLKKFDNNRHLRGKKKKTLTSMTDSNS